MQSRHVCSCQRQYITSARARVTISVFALSFLVRGPSQRPSCSAQDGGKLTEEEASDSALRTPSALSKGYTVGNTMNRVESLYVDE